MERITESSSKQHDRQQRWILDTRYMEPSGRQRELHESCLPLVESAVMKGFLLPFWVQVFQEEEKLRSSFIPAFTSLPESIQSHSLFLSLSSVCLSFFHSGVSAPVFRVPKSRSSKAGYFHKYYRCYQHYGEKVLNLYQRFLRMFFE